VGGVCYPQHTQNNGDVAYRNQCFVKIIFVRYEVLTVVLIKSFGMLRHIDR